MRHILLILLCLLLATPLTGQRYYALYSAALPCAEQVGSASEQYRPDIGRVLLNVDTPLLEYVAPVPRSGVGAAIMIIPGGGYTVEAYELEGTDIARYLSARGYHTFVLQHRLPARVDGDCRDHVALDDARRGMRLIRSLADSLGYAVDRVGVMGFSAGGHLAGSVSVHPAVEDSLSSRPDFSVLVYPVLIMGEQSGHAGSQEALLGADPDPTRLAYYNLPARVDSLTPPTLLVHASDDEGVHPRNSLRYYEQLVAHGVAADLRMYATGGHGFGAARERAAPVANWLEEVVAWLSSLRP